MEYGIHDKRLFLRLGDRATHVRHEEWGEGAVVEEMTSIVPGGTCLVRVLFEDGRQRTFNNDLDHEQCCYFFGVRRLFSVSLEDVLPSRVRARRRRPALPRPREAPAPKGAPASATSTARAKRSPRTTVIAASTRRRVVLRAR